MADADSRRYFHIASVSAASLDALLSENEQEGHRLIHLRVERRAGTATYVYTLFFKRGRTTAVTAARAPSARAPLAPRRSASAARGPGR